MVSKDMMTLGVGLAERIWAAGIEGAIKVRGFIATFCIVAIVFQGMYIAIISLSGATTALGVPSDVPGMLLQLLFISLLSGCVAWIFALGVSIRRKQWEWLPLILLLQPALGTLIIFTLLTTRHFVLQELWASIGIPAETQNYLPVLPPILIFIYALAGLRERQSDVFPTSEDAPVIVRN